MKEGKLSHSVRKTILFALDGLIMQYAVSASGYGNNLYATALGLPDSKLGLINLVSNAVGCVALLPLGVLGDRCKHAKTLPALIPLFISFVYLFFGSVPLFGALAIPFYFVGLGLTSGLYGSHSAPWLTLLGTVANDDERNRILAVRNICIYFSGMAAPLIFSYFLARAGSADAKLNVYRIFYYINGVASLIAAIIIFLHKNDDRPISHEHSVSLATFRKALHDMFSSKEFRSFFFCILFFYMSWHLDWSLWYIGEIRYIGMNEVQYGYTNMLTSLVECISIPVWARYNARKASNLDRSLAWGSGALGMAMIVMLVCIGLFPVGSRQWPFIISASVVHFAVPALTLAASQIILLLTPERNRALCVSIYTMAIMLSNSIMPYIGVKIYTAIGENVHTFTTLYSSFFVIRTIVTTVLIVRARRVAKRKKEIEA